MLKGLEPDVAIVVEKDLAIECLPFAHLEQCKLRRAIRLVRRVIAMPKTWLVRM